MLIHFRRRRRNNSEPAKFAQRYKSSEVRFEDRASMACLAMGELPITVDWLDKDGNLIQKSDKRFMLVPPTSKIAIEEEKQDRMALILTLCDSNPESTTSLKRPTFPPALSQTQAPSPG